MSTALQLDAFVASAPAPLVHRTHVRAHLRTVKGTTTSGATLRDRALAKPTTSGTRAALEYVRAQLAALYRSRAASWPKERTPYVNADDAARILREWAECPMEAREGGRQQNWRGSIFRKGWVLTGTSTPALRKHMRGTDLPGWRLA